MKTAVSFSQFATEEMIMKLLCRERAKFAVKNTEDSERNDPIYLEQIKPMMPPRKLWVNPSQKYRPKKGGKGIAAWTYPRKMADARIWATVLKYRKKTPDAPWLKNMDAFVSRIRGIVAGTEDFTMETPRVLAKFKKEDKGEFIYRPICMYTSLETKIILVLTYKYLLEVLDDCFHGNMLFMRSARRDFSGKRSTPNFTDAIRLTDSYRKKHDSQTIFVGECDIQKFYDILNHDDILECFDRLFALRVAKSGQDTDMFMPVRRIIETYLDSYDYQRCVMSLNDQSLRIWKGEKAMHKTKDCSDPRCVFKWVSDEAFISSGCYDRESLAAAKEQGKLGIPQGGALSGIMVNVVMQCIDEDIVREKDPERLFVRYCDDILLMHTDPKKCKEYLDIYHRNLVRHKLVAHVPVNVRDCKNGVRTHQDFWNAKSKNVYKWGEGGGDASDWVAFVGYEMRRTGEIRVRKDKIDEMFVRIAHRYFQVIPHKSGKNDTEKKPDKQSQKKKKEQTPQERLERFNSLAKYLDENYEMKTVDRYTIAQARRLDKYLERKIGQAAKRLGTDFPKDFTRFVTTLQQKES